MEKEYITNAKVTNNEWIKLGRHTFQQPNNLVASLSPNSVTQNGITNGGHAYKAINPIDDDSTTQNTWQNTSQRSMIDGWPDAIVCGALTCRGMW